MSTLPALSKFQSRQAALSNKRMKEGSSFSVTSSPKVIGPKTPTSASDNNAFGFSKSRSPAGSIDCKRLVGLNDRIAQVAEQSGARFQSMMKRICDIENRLEAARHSAEMKLSNLKDQIETAEEAAKNQSEDRAAATAEWERLLADAESRVKAKMRVMCQEFGKSEAEIRNTCSAKISEAKERMKKQDYEIGAAQESIEELTETELPSVIKDLKESVRKEQETSARAMHESIGEVREMRKWVEAEIAKRERREREMMLCAEEVEARLLAKLEDERIQRSARDELVLQKIEDGFKKMSSCMA